VLVDALRRHEQAVALLRAADDRAASELTRYEVLVGIHPDEEEATERLFAGLEWISVTEPVARLAAAFARELRGRFSGIEDADYLIAATAIDLDADLMTTNVRHFPMLAGLEPAY
jgi:predicted nucleic acid-binding protein